MTKTGKALGTLAAVALTVLPTSPAAPTVQAIQDDVVRLTNVERQKAGCAPLSRRDDLDVAAQRHSQDMAARNFLGHTGSTGSSFTTRIEQAGYTRWRIAAENVAGGYLTPKDVVAGLMSSPGHRANIINCELKDIGVGYATNPASKFRVYWTQDFGSR